MPKGKKAGGHAPQPRKVMMSGTLEHLSPNTLLIALSARKLLSREILAGQCVENAFATRRRC